MSTAKEQIKTISSSNSNNFHPQIAPIYRQSHLASIEKDEVIIEEKSSAHKTHISERGKLDMEIKEVEVDTF